MAVVWRLFRIRSNRHLLATHLLEEDGYDIRTIQLDEKSVKQEELRELSVSFLSRP
jgi:hypothetical protein